MPISYAVVGLYPSRSPIIDRRVVDWTRVIFIFKLIVIQTRSFSKYFKNRSSRLLLKQSVLIGLVFLLSVRWRGIFFITLPWLHYKDETNRCCLSSSSSLDEIEFFRSIFVLCIIVGFLWRLVVARRHTSKASGPCIISTVAKRQSLYNGTLTGGERCWEDRTPSYSPSQRDRARTCCFLRTASVWEGANVE